MEYSLRNLNKIANLNNLTLSNIVEKLNLIGLEVDNIIIETDLINDITLVLKIPANRDDLLNETRFAQQLSIIFDFELFKTWEILKENYSSILNKKYNQSLNFETIHIETDNSLLNSLVTHAIKLEKYNENIKVPSWIKKELNLLTDQTINPIEAILKLTLKEWGQSFNAIQINPEINRNLKLEFSTAGENFYLQEKEFRLSTNKTIVLKDKITNEIFSVLGIINTSLSKKNIIIESSFYNIVDNTLALSDLNSELSFRYLRRAFESTFNSAFQRLLTLLDIILDCSISPIIYQNKYKKSNQDKFLHVNKKIFSKILNIEKYNSTIFKNSDLKLASSSETELVFNIPEFRRDLIREIDIIEEYATLIGYKNFVEIFPEISNLRSENKNLKKEEFIKQYFLNFSFNEVFTTSLLSQAKHKKQSISLKNPLNLDLFSLRRSLTENLIETFETNSKLGMNNLKFFEIGRVYRYSHKLLEEEDVLSCIFPIEKLVNDNKVEWFVAKGFLENFLSSFYNLNFEFEKYQTSNEEKSTFNPIVFHPNKSLKILKENKIIGYFGELHPELKNTLNLKQNIYLFEINLKNITLQNLRSNIKTYEEYSKYPSIIKDLSFCIDRKESVKEIKSLLLKQLKYLKDVTIFDIYWDNKIDENSNLTEFSIGIRMEFQSFTKTLITEDVDVEIKKAMELLKQNFKAFFK